MFYRSADYGKTPIKFTNSDNRRIYCDDYSAILLTFVRRSRLCNKYNRNLPTANVVLFFHRLQFR